MAFIEWARRARAKPAFDLEEREYRLAVAAAGRALIGAARDGRPLVDPVNALRARVAESLDMVLPVPQMVPLARWAAEDDEGLARALRAFAEAGDDPQVRVERFAQGRRGRPAGRRPGRRLAAELRHGAGAAADRVAREVRAPPGAPRRPARSRDLPGGAELRGPRRCGAPRGGRAGARHDRRREPDRPLRGAARAVGGRRRGGRLAAALRSRTSTSRPA